jgi:hypothetical protein
VAGKAPTVFPVTQRQAHVLREEWRGLASDGRDVLSMEDLTGESALELDDPFHASSLFLRGSPRRQIDTQVGAQPLRYAVHPQLRNTSDRQTIRSTIDGCRRVPQNPRPATFALVQLERLEKGDQRVLIGRR